VAVALNALAKTLLTTASEPATTRLRARQRARCLRARRRDLAKHSKVAGRRVSVRCRSQWMVSAETPEAGRQSPESMPPHRTSRGDEPEGRPATREG